jgi:hypothetical protein
MQRILVRIGTIVMVALAAAGAPSAQTSGEKLEITAFAVNMSNIVTGSTAVVDITVNQWSTEAERERLITTMLEKSSDTLLRELQRVPEKGRFRIPAARPPDPHQLALGHDLRYAWQTALPEGGRRIVLITDRYIGFQEARANPRTMDYPFTIIEIRVDRNGEGQGKLAIATMIDFDKKKKQIVLENYSSEPVRLNNVKVKVKQ